MQSSLMSLYLKENNYHEDDLFSIIMAFDQTCIIAITNHQGMITFTNKKFNEISGYRQEELIGQDHRIINSGHHSKEFFQEMWFTIKSGNIWQGEIKNRKKCGEYYWVNTTIIPLKDPQGIIQKFISIRHDITDQKNSDQNLTHLAGLISAGEVATCLSHELNTPLTFIMGKCQRLQSQIDLDKLDKEKLINSIEMINNTAARMVKLVKGMQELGSNPHHEFTATPISTMDIIADAIDLANIRLHTKQIKLITPQVEDCTIMVNPVEIVQIIINLLNNAIDAIENSNSAWIKIITEVYQNEVVIKVLDSGTGIPDEIVAKMNNPFFTTKSSGKGSGLGLSISRKLAKKNRGQLNIDTTNANTCFVLQLPRT